MTSDDKNRGEKLQCDINREAAKTALLSGKVIQISYRWKNKNKNMIEEHGKKTNTCCYKSKEIATGFN